MSDLIAGLLAPSTVLLSVAVIASWRRRWRTALAAAATLWLLATPPVASLAIRAGEAFAVRRSIDSVQPADAVVLLSAGVRSRIPKSACTPRCEGASAAPSWAGAS